MKALAFIDIEATSADSQKADIIEIAFLVKNEQDEIIDHFHSLVKPSRKIPEDIQELTGINPAMVENAPEFHEIGEKVFSKLKGVTLVAHKADFDHHILKTKFLELGMEFHCKTKCTLKMAQTLAPGMSSYSLQALCGFFGIPLKKNHRAMQDAEATAQLFQVLSLLSGTRERKESYLKKHEKLIKRARPIPGIVSFKDHEGAVFYSKAVENIKAELADKLELNLKNNILISSCAHVEIEETGSLAIAMLLQARREKAPSWSIYSFKDKKGEIIVRCGRVKPNKRAVLYFHQKKKALAVLEKIKKASKGETYAYRDGQGADKSEIMKKNAIVEDELKKLKPSLENMLIRSRHQIDGRYQYVLIRGNDRFAVFDHPEELSSSEELSWSSLKFEKLRPCSTRALELSLQYIKNQKNKTDFAFKVKRPS